MFELASLLLQAGLGRLAGACAACAAMGMALVGIGAGQAPSPCTPIATVAQVTVWRQERQPAAVVFRAGMTIDVDGAPTAYHPQDREALNRLAHAGRPGHWWALVTRDGQPVVQGRDDLAPGYFVSMTSLEDPAFAVTDPRRYLDASTIPYVALPEAVTRAGGIRLGDLVAVVNQANGKVAYAIYADAGPKGHIGEGSLYLANQLRDAPLPDALGARRSLTRGIVYVVFPGSGSRRSPTRQRARQQIVTAAASLFDRWGGVPASNVCLHRER